MKLLLKRMTFTNNSTIGELSIDGEHECYTLEDVVRDKKIKGITAIPFGIYKIIINMSNRFQRLMPLLLDVPEFEGVRIHSGNTSADTEGCILVGVDPKTDYIGKSRDTFSFLFPKIQEAIDNGEEVTIEIVDGRE
jgi:hypothetical protein